MDPFHLARSSCRKFHTGAICQVPITHLSVRFLPFTDVAPRFQLRHTEELAPLRFRSVRQLRSELPDPPPLEIHGNLPECLRNLEQVPRIGGRIHFLQLEVRIYEPALKPQQNRVELSCADHLGKHLSYDLIIAARVKKHTEHCQIVCHLVELDIMFAQLLYAGIKPLPIALLHPPPHPFVGVLPQFLRDLQLVREVCPQQPVPIIGCQ
mmetsp:Transcript_28346/g.80092  ORF Transcript_28346/g.80092 Transcript_28346/m.80092 type:complete len:209 (-) Transcript_28346:266-892(-)